jgi:sterol desaturase/sphingolipid hydroxylase (fatty acid hydroxylase superfamily)
MWTRLWLMVLVVLAAAARCRAFVPPRPHRTARQKLPYQWKDAKIGQKNSSTGDRYEPQELWWRDADFLRAPQPSSSAITKALQSMHLCLAGGAILSPDVMNAGTAVVWHAFDAAAVTHHYMFEATLAVACFTVFVAFFETLHLVLPRAEQFRIDGQPPIEPLANFLPGGLHKSLVPPVAYLGSIAIYHALGLGDMLFGPAPAEIGDPSFFRVVSETSIGVFLYDLCFYPIHLYFHMGPLRGLHQRHHRWAQSENFAHNAVETVQNSYLDAGIQVFINICIQHLSPWGFKHPLSRALHNMMVVYLLTESHSGYNLPFMSHRLFPGVFGGPIRHEVHHRHGGVYFHQFFTYLDDALGHTLAPSCSSRKDG